MKRIKRSFFKESAMALSALTLGVSCGELLDDTAEIIERHYEAPAPLEHFNGLSSGVLVLAANDTEKQTAIATLQKRSQERPNKHKRYKFEQRGKIVRAVSQVQIEDETKEVPVILISQHDLHDDTVLHRLEDESFHMVQLRGHTSDMKELHRKALPYMDEYSLLVLGGCKSARFIDDWYTSKRPIIADKNTGESVVNTYMLMQLVNNIGISDNWSDLHEKISSMANLDKMGITMPGAPDYADNF